MKVGETVHIQTGMFGSYKSDNVAIVRGERVQCVNYREWLDKKDVARVRVYDPAKGTSSRAHCHVEQLMWFM